MEFILIRQANHTKSHALWALTKKIKKKIFEVLS